MPIEFSAPPLVSTTKKLEGALKEWDRLSAYLEVMPEQEQHPALNWSRIKTIASAIHNVYVGLEGVMKTIGAGVDAFVPTGPSSHKDILDHLASPRKGVRPALIGESWYADMTELLGFRHMVNHSCFDELREDLVLENLDRMKTVIPLFLAALEDLDAHLSGPTGGGDGTEVIPDPFDS